MPISLHFFKGADHEKDEKIWDLVATDQFFKRSIPFDMEGETMVSLSSFLSFTLFGDVQQVRALLACPGFV